MSRAALTLKTTLTLIWQTASPGSRRFVAAAFGALMGLLTYSLVN